MTKIIKLATGNVMDVRGWETLPYTGKLVRLRQEPC